MFFTPPNLLPVKFQFLQLLHDIVLQLVAFLKHLLKVLLMLRHAAVELLLRDVHIFYLDVEILSGTQQILLVLVTKGTVPLVS